MEMRPTTVDELRKYASGAVIKLPNFADGMPLYVRMRRPSMLDMIASGKIPNPLASIAASLFAKGGRAIDAQDPGQVKELVDIFHIFCEVSFVEPTYQQIKEAGLELNDEQLVFVSNYIQGGTKALEHFRRKSESVKPAGNVAKVQKGAVRDSGN